MSQRGLKRLFWTAGVVMFVVGLFGWYDRLAHGHIGANYGSVVTWGLWVAAYIYFIGLSAGAFLISSLVYVFQVKSFQRIGRLALFTAVVTLFLALLAIWVDLGHMGRAWHVIVYPNFSSPMAWMIWMYLFYFLLVVVELWVLLRRDLVAARETQGWAGVVFRILSLGSRNTSDSSAQRDLRIVRVLATIGVPLAVMFHGRVGTLFGVVAARPYWHSGLYPILFLLGALVSGGALLTVVAAIFQDGWRRNRQTVLSLGKLVLALLVLDVLLQASEMLVGLYGDVPAYVNVLKLVLGGPYWWVFWGWQLVLATLIPIAILSFRSTRQDARWVSAAGLLIAVGFLGVRLNIVIPGLAMEEIQGLSAAFVSPRLTPDYFPSAMEWLLTVGITGLGLLLFGLGEKFLPRDRSVVDVAETAQDTEAVPDALTA